MTLHLKLSADKTIVHKTMKLSERHNKGMEIFLVGKK